MSPNNTAINPILPGGPNAVWNWTNRVPRAIRKEAGRRAAAGATAARPGIAAQLRRAITDGVYGYGDRLPPEREIARSFGISRTTVRSALDLLEERNFIRRKIGSGTFVVHDRGQANARSPTSPVRSS